MARTIESPGVEIREVDLSLRASLPIGTKVLLHGFAAQGPTNELILVSSRDELDQIFFAGAGPTNAAERYFYHSAREILNSPATLYVTRLPYGSGDGTGFNGEYTALAYPAIGYNYLTTTVTNSALLPIQTAGPVISANELFGRSLPDYVNLNSITLTLTRTSSATTAQYSGTTAIAIVDNGAGILSASSALYSISGNINYATGVFNLSSYFTFDETEVFNLSSSLVASYSYNTRPATIFSTSTAIVLGEPSVIPLTESEYYDLKYGQVTWATTGGATLTAASDLGNAALVIVNDARTTINEKYEGYYVVIADQRLITDTLSSGFNSITGVETLRSDNSLRDLPSNLLGFTLTGDSNGSNPGNISEVVETSIPYDFADATFADSLIVYVFRLRTSPYASDPDKLYYVPAESYVGSLESQDSRANPVNGLLDTFYLPNKVNGNSNYIQMFVNTNIANFGVVGSVETTNPILEPIGSYAPCKDPNSTLKNIGSVPNKVTRALALAENIQNIDIDVVPAGGLENIWAYANEASGGPAVPYDEAANVAVDLADLADAATGASSSLAMNHRTIFNLYNNFCQQTRKDCMHISDPIRGIFVQGENGKTLDRKDRNFSQHVYTPLRNLYASANSNYAATYANWINAYDDNAGKFVWLPFSGWQTAIIARMDANLQPWFAPMGLNNGLIRNITDIALRTNQKQQDALYRIGVNPVVFFQGDGFVVWGQKTTQSKPSAFDRINVRRLFLVLERATMKVLRYFVAEPNTVFTRTRVVNVLKPIFELAKNNEGVYDYLIVCDERNNTPNVIDNNEMHVDIYLKPVRTAEFILVTFFATRTDQDFNELVG